MCSCSWLSSIQIPDRKSPSDEWSNDDKAAMVIYKQTNGIEYVMHGAVKLKRLI